VIDAGGEDPDLLELVERTVAAAQGVVIHHALDAATRIFEVGGASIASGAHALDRHWRNARTLASHNPLSYKYRSLGANLLNGDELPYHWSVGVRTV
jgi:alkylation response protein AidB-like acyl-CoA dehydrogenase